MPDWSWVASVSIPYLIGYVYAIVLGGFLTDRIVNTLSSAVREPGGRPFPWLAMALGSTERSLYFASWYVSQPGFIAVWLALKVASRWKRWTEDRIVDGKTIPARVYFDVFLIGNGLSVAYGSTGLWFARWWNEGIWHRAVLWPLGLCVVSLILWFWVKRHAERE